MSIAEVEARIRAAVAEAKARGWAIRAGIYFVALPPQCCVLGACILDQIESASVHATVPESAAHALGISYSDANRLAMGFDLPNATFEDEYVDLGHRLRDLITVDQ